MSRNDPARGLIVALLTTAALIHLGYQFFVIGLDGRDAGPYETVLAQATAGQLRDGAGSLYGPFDGEHPSVLMHAPAYYRLVALVAWFPTRAGADPLDASLVVGRLVTVCSTIVLLALSWRMARLDGLSRIAGLVATALVASSPILGVLAIMVRPDTFGVALSTAGCLIVARVIVRADESRAGWMLAWSFGLFALAVAVKQQNILAPMVSAAWLIAHRRSGRVGLIPIVGGLSAGVCVGLGVLIAEEVATKGLMGRTVLELPGGAFRAINHGGWEHVATILADCVKRSIGLIALGSATLFLCRDARRFETLDRALVLYLAAEVAALVPLCLYNKGAADNYALQAVVFASVLVGRSVTRALESPSSRAILRAGLVASVAVLIANEVRLIRHVESCRRIEADPIRTLIEKSVVSQSDPSERYFVGLAGYNRRHGRRELIHDEWLYGAFEAIAEAEPRDRWLRAALKGPVRQVIVPSGSPVVPGVRDSLDRLGFLRTAAAGPYEVWTRR